MLKLNYSIILKMKNTIVFKILLLCFSFQTYSQTEKLKITEKSGSHSLNSHHYFIENKGQWDDEILFKTSFKGGNLWIQKSKLFFHLKDFAALHENHAEKKCDTCLNKQHALHLNFKNCNEVKRVVKNYPSEEYYNYFLGNDSTKWAKNVRAFKEITMYDLYSGIDLRIIQDDEVTKYEYVVSPNFSPTQISLEIAGADKIVVGNKGELIIKTPLGNIQENKPYAYQVINSKKKQIACEFIVLDSIVKYKIGKYDPNYELIIDPVLVFATYSGSVTDNFGMTATYGHDGSAYSGGTIFGNSYPTPFSGAYNTKSNFTFASNFSQAVASDIFISKYNTDGSKMIWTNFIGGGNNFVGAETVHSLICDKDDNLYAFGATSSLNFPTTQNALQTNHNGGSVFNATFNGAYFGVNGVDIISFQFSSDGTNLNASTYIGGNGNDGINSNLYGVNNSYDGFIYYDSLTGNYGDQFRGEIMLDAQKNIYIASSTRSTNFPLQSPILNSIQGQQDGVILKLTNDLSTLLFSTYLGGSNNDALYSIKIDSSNNIVFCGGTSSSNFPTSNLAYQKVYGGGKADGIIGKINQNNFTLTSATYIGLSQFDQCYFVEIDDEDNIYFIGHSVGGNWPVINSIYQIPNSTQIIVKMDSLLKTIIQSTKYGSGNPNKRDISPAAFLVDDCKNIYVSGWGANIIQTNEKLIDMPITSNAFIANPPNGYDFHLFAINRTFEKMIYGSYLGGNKADEHVDGGTSRFDKNGVIYQSICGGCGGHSDFPTTSIAWSQKNLSRNCNNIVLKFDFEILAVPKITFSNDTSCVENYIKLINTSTGYNKFYWEDLNTKEIDSIHDTITKFYTIPGDYQINLNVKNDVCNRNELSVAKLKIIPNDILIPKIPLVEHCEPRKDTIILKTNKKGNKFTWSLSNDFSPLINNNIQDSILIYESNTSTKLYYKIENRYCYKIDSVDINVLNADLKLNNKPLYCQYTMDTISVNLTTPHDRYTYNWNVPYIFNSSVNNDSIFFVPDKSGEIIFTAISEKGCKRSDTIEINLLSTTFNQIDINATPKTILRGETTQLEEKSNNYTYTWLYQNDSILGTQNPIKIRPKKSSYYTLKISQDACTISDTIHINVIEDWVCDFPFIFVPNAFSPNNDGENDTLFVRGRPAYQIEFRVFNRWGENVFYSNDLKKGWDGTYKGEKLPPDVYDYYLIVQCIDETKKQIQGNVTLLK